MMTTIADVSEKIEKLTTTMSDHQANSVQQATNGFLDDTVWVAFLAQLEANRQTDIAKLDCLPIDASGD